MKTALRRYFSDKINSSRDITEPIQWFKCQTRRISLYVWSEYEV